MFGFQILRQPHRSARVITLATPLLALALAGCQSIQAPPDRPLGLRLDESIQVFASPQNSERAPVRAAAEYRRLAAENLPELLADATQRPLVPVDAGVAGIQSPDKFADVEPVTRPRLTRPERHRSGLGLPLMRRVFPGDANAPSAGYRLPLTLLALPKDPPGACCEAAPVNPDRVPTVRAVHGDLPLAMDLEAPLAATSATGPRLGSGLPNLLRPGGFTGRPRTVGLQLFDHDTISLVLVHGLLSTPRMWEPLVKDPLTDPEIRARGQFWFFYYPTGQPVPLSALQLREALDGALKAHGPNHPMTLLGHSMGGILSRAQVCRWPWRTRSPSSLSWRPSANRTGSGAPWSSRRAPTWLG